MGLLAFLTGKQQLQHFNGVNWLNVKKKNKPGQYRVVTFNRKGAVTGIKEVENVPEV